MGEKGNAVEAVGAAVPGASGLGERAAGVASGTTGDVIRKARDEVVGTVTGHAMTAAGGRLRRDKEDKTEKADDETVEGDDAD